MTQQFPKALSIKKADHWLAENNPYFAIKFWNDQRDKHIEREDSRLKGAQAFLKFALISYVASLIGSLIFVAVSR